MGEISLPTLLGSSSIIVFLAAKTWSEFRTGAKDRLAARRLGLRVSWWTPPGPGSIVYRDRPILIAGRRWPFTLLRSRWSIDLRVKPLNDQTKAGMALLAADDRIVARREPDHLVFTLPSGTPFHAVATLVDRLCDTLDGSTKTEPQARAQGSLV